jgi:hypothetical protein
MVNINSIAIKIQSETGTIEPIYEVHSYEKAQEVLEATLKGLEGDRGAKVSWSLTGTIVVA